jgi:anaerobic C4-dicarboxylate transporter DcuA
VTEGAAKATKGVKVEGGVAKKSQQVGSVGTRGAGMSDVGHVVVRKSVTMTTNMSDNIMGGTFKYTDKKVTEFLANRHVVNHRLMLGDLFKECAMFWVQLAILSAVILGSIRLKSVGFGLLGYLGLAILTFLFHVKPADPPLEVLVTITTLAVALGSVTAAGGLAYLLDISTRIIKKHPNQIRFLGPIISYFVVFLSGNQHIMHAILPCITQISQKVGVRWENTLATSVTAASQAQLASPISLYMVLIACCLSPSLTILHILKVLLLSTLGSVLLAVLIAKKLVKLPKHHISFNSDGTNQKTDNVVQKATLHAHTEQVTAKAKISFIVLLIGGMLSICSYDYSLRLRWDMNSAKLLLSPFSIFFAMIMLSVAAVTVLLCNVNPSKIIRQTVAQEHVQLLIHLLGITWFIDTLLQFNKADVITLLQASTMPTWVFGLMLLVTALLTKSPLGAIHSIVPFGIWGGLSPTMVLVTLVALNGVLETISNLSITHHTIQLSNINTTHRGNLVKILVLLGVVTTIAAVYMAWVLQF